MRKVIDADDKQWVDAFLSFLDKKSIVFEVGSGTGVFANYLEKKGYAVIRSDYDKVFINYQKKLKKEVLFFDVLKGNPSISDFDGVILGCVMNFLSPFGVDKAIKNSKKLIKPGGYFAFNVNHEWGEIDVKRLLKKHSLKLKYLSEDKNKCWYYVVCGR